MFAAGKCLKKGDWIISIYRCVGDPYVTMKVKKVKVQDQRKTIRYIGNVAFQSLDEASKEKIQT